MRDQDWKLKLTVVLVAVVLGVVAVAAIALSLEYDSPELGRALLAKVEGSKQ